MADNGFKLDMFSEAYGKANAALERGDADAAKRYFLRAAELMEDIAETSEPKLKEARKARAAKLRFIADNAQNAVASDGGGRADGKSGKETDGGGFLRIAKPTEKISFDEIIGLDDAKAAIHKLLIDPLKNPEVYARYGIKAGGFILLEGPPGTGKTTFAKAAASELSVPFAEVDSNALIDSFIGKTGKNIDGMFAEARALASKNGTPVVLFLDEIDYLAQKRGGENKTAAEAVPTLIKQMDGFSTGSDDIVLIAATNIKASLDPAVLSRFRNVIHIPLPTESEREKLFALKLRRVGKADFDCIDLAAAARRSDGFSGRDISQVSLDLLNALAARDAGLRELGAPVNDLLCGLIERRAKNR